MRQCAPRLQPAVPFRADDGSTGTRHCNSNSIATHAPPHTAAHEWWAKVAPATGFCQTFCRPLPSSAVELLPARSWSHTKRTAEHSISAHCGAQQCVSQHPMTPGHCHRNSYTHTHTSASSASVSSCSVSARLARSAYSRPAARAASSRDFAAAADASADASKPANRSDSCSARDSAD